MHEGIRKELLTPTPEVKEAELAIRDAIRNAGFGVISKYDVEYTSFVLKPEQRLSRRDIALFFPNIDKLHATITIDVETGLIFVSPIIH